MDTVMWLYREYEYLLTRADERTADWPLMWAYWPTFLLTGLYLLAVYVGPKLMLHRPAFQFRWTLFFYNAILVLINFHIFTELISASYKLNYSYTCQLVDYGDNPDELRIAKAIWWYYISKLLEFADTIFFILRKKNGQISFLHVYHHATMFPIWWIGVKWVPGGQAFFGAMINSFTHVLMYTYYGVSALGPDYQRYLWWKRYLTNIQLIQFVAGMVHAGQSIALGCGFPLWMQWALILYGMSILALFLNFYFQAYIKPRTTSRGKTAKEEQQNGSAMKPEPLSNGVKPANASNGVISEENAAKRKKSGSDVANGAVSAKTGTVKNGKPAKKIN